MIISIEKAINILFEDLNKVTKAVANRLNLIDQSISKEKRKIKSLEVKLEEALKRIENLEERKSYKKLRRF